MIQSYKIHINDNTVFLEDEAHWQFKNYIIKDKELYIPYVDEAQTKQLVEDIYNKYQGHTFFVIASDLSALKTSFFNQFKLIVNLYEIKKYSNFGKIRHMTLYVEVFN